MSDHYIPTGIDTALDPCRLDIAFGTTNETNERLSSVGNHGTVPAPLWCSPARYYPELLASEHGMRSSVLASPTKPVPDAIKQIVSN